MLQDVIISLIESISVYFIVVNALAAFLFCLSVFHLKRYRQAKQSPIPTENLNAVTFIIPAYNEESLITETIQTYLQLKNIKKEIIVVDDGSADHTFKLLQAMFQLRRNDPSSGIFTSISNPDLIVIKAQHEGKAKALNLGIAHAKYELICTMDADTIPSPQGVISCLESFYNNPKLIAAGGIIKVLKSHVINGNTPHPLTSSVNLLTALQNVEYLQAFVGGRIAWGRLRSTTLISGAFCMARKSAVQKIGCFTNNSITEDLDLIVRLRRHFKDSDYKFDVLPVITCHTQVPGKIKHLKEQRMRWHMGLVQTLSRNFSLTLNPTYGLLGILAIPYLWLVEVLSPLVELLAVVLISFALISGWIIPEPVLYLLGLGMAISIALSFYTLHIEREHLSSGRKTHLFKSLFHSVVFHIGYRQLTSYWRFIALVKSFGKSSHWGGKLRKEIIHQNL